MQIEKIEVEKLIGYAHNPVIHSDEQIDRLASSISEFGFTVPVLINKDGVLIAGHGRLLAAKKLALTEVPAIRLEHLTPSQQRAYRILDNKLTKDSEWDYESLEMELDILQEEDFDLAKFGLDDFESPELEEDEELKVSAPSLVTCPKCDHEFDPHE